MLDQPSKKPESLEFDPVIKVFCLANNATIKGLQWVLDRRSFSDRKFQLFPGNLTQIQEASADSDILFMALEMGQPVPVENLRKNKEVLGLCALEQPTPSQLLQLLELGGWQAMPWDGSSFEKVAERLDLLATQNFDRLKEREFLQTARSWIHHHEYEAARITWTNPPSAFDGVTSFMLDKRRASLSLGGLKSSADVRLPLAGAEEFCLFQFRDQKWALKKLSTQGRLQFHGKSAEDIRAGDSLEIDEHKFLVQKSDKVQQLARAAQRLGLIKDGAQHQLRSDASSTLSDLIKELMFAGLEGELRLSANLKNGALYFEEGVLRQAVSGPVVGLKALLRMLGWDKPSWKFNPGRRAPAVKDRLNLHLSDFSKIHQQWQKKWADFANLAPPANLRLQTKREVFLTRTKWSSREYQVLAAVCEYVLVRDILNSCKLHDVEIFETLVDLRKQGLIEIQSH